jgi:UPF0271 protein
MKAERRIDINCDIGEEVREDAKVTPAEEALLDAVTSVNIACGFHGGDPNTMAALTQAAAKRGIAIGAHPSLPDREGFGRREMPVPPDQIYNIVLYQIAALSGFAIAAGSKLSHVKPHGALYHMAEKDDDIAQVIACAVRDFAPQALVVGLSGGRLVRMASEAGLGVANEAFADRAYLPNGNLAPRGTPGAVIVDPDAAVERVLRLLQDGEVEAQDGSILRLAPDTLCIHRDSPGSGALARTLRARLTQAGFTPSPLRTP